MQGLEEDDDMLSIELVVGRSLYCMHGSCFFGRKAVGLGALSTQESAYLGVKGRTRKERKPKVKPTNGFSGSMAGRVERRHGSFAIPFHRPMYGWPRG